MMMTTRSVSPTSKPDSSFALPSSPVSLPSEMDETDDTESDISVDDPPESCFGVLFDICHSVLARDFHDDSLSIDDPFDDIVGNLDDLISSSTRSALPSALSASEIDCLRMTDLSPPPPPPPLPPSFHLDPKNHRSSDAVNNTNEDSLFFDQHLKVGVLTPSHSSSLSSLSSPSSSSSSSLCPDDLSEDDFCMKEFEDSPFQQDSFWKSSYFDSDSSNSSSTPSTNDCQSSPIFSVPSMNIISRPNSTASSSTSSPKFPYSFSSRPNSFPSSPSSSSSSSSSSWSSRSLKPEYHIMIAGHNGVSRRPLLPISSLASVTVTNSTSKRNCKPSSRCRNSCSSSIKAPSSAKPSVKKSVKTSVSSSSKSGRKLSLKSKKPPNSKMLNHDLLVKVLDRLMTHHWAHVFISPVDPVTMNLPDYFKIVKRPMNLARVRNQLLCGFYRKIDEFCRDTELVWSNALSYNPKGSDVYVMATSLQKYYFSLIKPFPRSWSLDQSADKFGVS